MGDLENINKSVVRRFSEVLNGDWSGAPDEHANRAVGPASTLGQAFEFDYSGVIRLAGGKMAELWITWDNLAILTQLGHLPPALN